MTTTTMTDDRLMTDYVHNRPCGTAAVARGGKGRGSSAVVAIGCSSGVAARAG